ncbi:unnamed protein product, partial [Amoebophrya sp. A25]
QEHDAKDDPPFFAFKTWSAGAMCLGAPSVFRSFDAGIVDGGFLDPVGVMREQDVDKYPLAREERKLWAKN